MTLLMTIFGDISDFLIYLMIYDGISDDESDLNLMQTPLIFIVHTEISTGAQSFKNWLKKINKLISWVFLPWRRCHKINSYKVNTD